MFSEKISTRVRVRPQFEAALAEHDKKEAYPEAVAQAHADFADLQGADDIPRPRRTRIRRPADLLTPEEADLRQRLQDQVLRSSETE